MKEKRKEKSTLFRGTRKIDGVVVCFILHKAQSVVVVSIYIFIIDARAGRGKSLRALLIELFFGGF